MSRRLLKLGALSVLAALPSLASCSSSDAVVSATTPDKCGADGGSVTAYASVCGGGVCSDVRPLNDAFCHGASEASCASTQSCNLSAQRGWDTCCVMVHEPTPQAGYTCPPPASDPTKTSCLARTNDTIEYAGSGATDLSCFDEAHWPKLNASKTVTMKGVAKIFANGCESTGVTIEVWTVKRGGADDGKLGTLVGSPVTTAIDNTDPTTYLEETADACADPRKVFKFEYPGVPTDVELLIKTYDKSTPPSWATMYDYNQFVSTGDPEYDEAGGVWNHNVRAVASSDYQLIPNVAGNGPIKAGNAVIAGEIHDCGNVRVSNATVDVNIARNTLAYFTENESKPLPDNARSGIGSTSKLGLYAALDVPAKTEAEGGLPFTMAAAGLYPDPANPAKSQLVSLGFFQARTFSNCVTAVTLRGLRAFQVPTK